MIEKADEKRNEAMMAVSEGQVTTVTPICCGVIVFFLVQPKMIVIIIPPW